MVELKPSTRTKQINIFTTMELEGAGPQLSITDRSKSVLSLWPFLLNVL